MNDKELREVIKKHNLHPKSYKKIKNVYVIDSQEERYVLKLNTNNYDIYKYLLSRDFSYFPLNYNRGTGNYDLSRYIEDNSLSDEQKLSDLVSIVASLHKKTSFNREIDLDEIKEIYENLSKDIDDKINYYTNLNDYLDTITFYSPSEYLLLRNISLIYFMLEYSKRKLVEWYKNISGEKTIRSSLIHNNLDLEHLLINNGYYLISWDKAMFNSPIMDLNHLYKKYYHKSELRDLISNYEGINPLNKIEYDLLLIKLAIPEKIEFTNDTMEDTIKINDHLLYLHKVHKVLKQEQVNQNN